jgi:hypothetical protein
MRENKMSKRKKITVLKIRADHISSIGQGKVQTLVVINAKNISPMKIGFMFNSVEITDHGRIKHTMDRPVMVIDYTYIHYDQDRTKVRDVCHIMLVKL